MQHISVRRAQASDATAIAEIYNQGIEDRIATFETRLRTAADIERWFDGRHPVVVCMHGEATAAFAATSAYRDRPCYAEVAEFSVYVGRAFRKQGLGKLAMQGLISEAEKAGLCKLVSRIFPENQASRRLMASVGFREVGVYIQHAKLDGVWKDTVIVERLLHGDSTG